ncbi:hypothetical protein F511_00603 [Dorcoceras hygrometricum]|nr:hypothetical protein F511_00603 [Dorcoceras hygrometricum]
MASLFSALIVSLLLIMSVDAVMGMVNLVKQYPLLEEINPDPCLPPVWSWIDCNSDPRPRVIALDLHQTNLYGIIPSFLGDFPDLRELLDGNYGLYTSSNSCPSGKNTAIPTAGTTPDYSVDGNNYGYTTTTYRRRKSRTPVIVGSTVSVTGVIGIAAGIFAIFRHKAKVAAAVAAANRQGANDEQSNPKLYTEHTGETPLQTRPTNM